MNKASARTVDILEYLSKLSDYGAGISEISRELNIPKSSVSDIIYTLLNKNFVQYDNEKLKTFKIGLKIIQIGFSSIQQIDVLQIARPYIEQLNKLINLSVFLAVENNNQVVYVDKIENDTPIHFSIKTGSAFPMHLTGVGKAILAAHTDEEVLSIMGDGCYPVRTENSISTHYGLMREIIKIRNQGYAVENFEENDYIYSIAAPIYDNINRVCAAISVFVLGADLGSVNIENIIDNVKQTAIKISSIMGYSKKTTY